MSSLQNYVLSEDELDVLVSIAIQRAELLADRRLPNAREAWREAMEYEIQLAAITNPADIPGGVARVGAISAALAAGLRREASELRDKYLNERELPDERRRAIDTLFSDDLSARSKRYPSLTRSGNGLSELAEWSKAWSAKPRVFPIAVGLAA